METLEVILAGLFNNSIFKYCTISLSSVISYAIFHILKTKKLFFLLKYWLISFANYSFKALAKISLIKIEAQVFQIQDFS